MNPSYKVCIIDDDPVFVFGTKKLIELSRFGSSVITFQHGREALDELVKLCSTPDRFPDIIFVDVNMPVMDGWEFLNELYSLPIPDSVNVFLVSSSTDPTDQEKAESIKQLTGYIIKPFSVERLEKLKSRLKS